MAYPITRQFGPNAKGSELTFADMDNNLLYLDSKVTGSNNYIPMYSGSTYLTSSVMYQLGGNIGIGITSPNGKLQVVGGSITTAIANAYNTCATRFDLANPAISLGIGYVNTDIPMLQGFNNLLNIATDITINPFGGNVGIGTTAPNSKLTINGNTTITGSITSSNGMLVRNGGQEYFQITSTGDLTSNQNKSYFGLRDVNNAFVLYSEYNSVNQLRIDAFGSITYLQESDGEVNIGFSTYQGNKLSVNGSTLLSGSATITNVLTLPPVNPLPSGKPTGSLAVSGSGANCKIYFFNGSWNALF